MDQIICRDCGLELPASARGCPRCALSFEVEKKIDRVVLWVIAGVILLGGLIAYLFLR